LQEAIDCDVCVIGAGFTGLSAALHLAQRGYDVVVLDAHRAGWGASGRNGGQLGSGQRVDQEELESLVGVPDAHRLWQLSQAAKLLVKDLIRDHSIECDLTPGILYTDHRPRYREDSKRYAQKLQSEYDYPDIRWIDQPELREMLGTRAYYAATLDLGAAHLHPLNYALGLARAADTAGVRFYDNSEVLRLVPGEPASIETRQGVVKARFVAMACNGYLGALNRQVASRVMPINNFIIATEPLSQALARELIRDNVAVADSKFVVNYFRLSACRRLLFGGRESYGYRFPADIKSFVRKAMLEIYPQLDQVTVDYGWGGTLAITMNRMPYLARCQPNVFNASGYSGHGVGLATLAGQLLSEVIGGTAERFDVMARVPVKRFPGGMAMRSPLLKLAMLYYGMRDKL
jgi:gamma-glutamylputrescine oxidase